MMKRGTGFKTAVCMLFVMLFSVSIAAGTASAATTTLNCQTVTSAKYGVVGNANIDVTSIVNAAALSAGLVWVYPGGGYGGFSNYLPNLEITDPATGQAKELDIYVGATEYKFYDGDKVSFSGFSPDKSITYSSISSASYSVVDGGTDGIPSGSDNVTAAVQAAAQNYSYVYVLPAGYNQPVNLQVPDPAVGYVKELNIVYVDSSGQTQTLTTFAAFDFNLVGLTYKGGTESFPVLSAAPSYFEK
jgi:hypothetical protein